MARPAKLSKEIIAKIHDGLVAGNYIDTACEYAGIAPASYYRWMKEAEADDAPELLLEFRESVKSARAEAEYRNVALIQQAAQKGTWQAAAWWLERTNANRWGRQQKVTAEVSGIGGGPIEVVDAKAAVIAFLESQTED